MGLFKKENCVLCGEKVGLLDTKTSDGKVCKECKKKLSVWFDDYKNASADTLKGQIAQKETDIAKAGLLNFNKVFGEFGVILIDEEEKVFTAFADTSTSFFGNQKNVRSIADVMDLKPDLIRFDMVTGFDIDIKETSREDKKTVNGNQVSYDPPHYTYMYSFTIRMTIDHPYIKSVYVPLNPGTVQIKSVGRRQWTDPGRKLAAHLLGLPTLVIEDQEKVYDNASLLSTLMRSEYELPSQSYGFQCTVENRNDLKKYHYYLTMARQIESIIMGE